MAKPQVDGFKIKATLKGKLKDLVPLLRSVSFLEVVPEKDSIDVIYVENKDIEGNPYLFSILKIKKDSLEVMYSITPEISPRKRRVDVLKYLLNILSLIEEKYDVDVRALFKLIEEAIAELSNSVTMEYTKLYTQYDSLKKEVEDLRRRVDRLTEQNKVLTTANYELKTENDELRLKLSKLMRLSDEALKAKLQEWIVEHNGSINVTQFSKVHKVPESRVEEMLNRLVSEGYLEVIR